jgi:hypothetical protein
MDAWAKKRLGELTAAAPTKRKNRKDDDPPFVMVPLWWLERVAKATHSPQQVFVGLWLLHLRWKAKSPRFPVPNGQLAKHGISRHSKRLALASLAAAGLIAVEQTPKKSPHRDLKSVATDVHGSVSTDVHALCGPTYIRSPSLLSLFSMSK